MTVESRHEKCCGAAQRQGVHGSLDRRGGTLVDKGTSRTGTGADGSGGRRLVGWKAIGQFLRCTERTARRWEAYRGMPVHRIPGGGRSSVWASPDELTGWLQALPSEVQATLRAEAAISTPTPTTASEPPT